MSYMYQGKYIDTTAPPVELNMYYVCMHVKCLRVILFTMQINCLIITAYMHYCGLLCVTCWHHESTQRFGCGFG